MLKKIGGFFNSLKKDKKGDTNTIGWIVLVIFIILVAAPMIQDIGETVRDGAQNLNNKLTETLTEQ